MCSTALWEAGYIDIRRPKQFHLGFLTERLQLVLCLASWGLSLLELTASGSAWLYVSAKQMTAAYDVMSLLTYQDNLCSLIHPGMQQDLAIYVRLV